MPILEAIIGLGIIAPIGSVVHRWMRDRHELRRLRAQAESARSAEKIVETMMLDKELAGAIYERLGEALERSGRASRRSGDGG